MLDDFKIGHYTDEARGTGLTAIICEQGAVGGVSVRGAAPATRETELLKTEKTVSVVHAIVLSGGSAYGLEGCSGVMAFLRSVNAGVNAGKYKVPIVCGASLYDLEYKEFAFPDKNAGVMAGKEAKTNNFTRGIKGVATGATASKVLGMDYAVKTGLGIQTYSSGDLEIAVICGVNPLGDIMENGKIIAGAKDVNGEFIGAQQVLSSCCFNAFSISNTTIGCIITNAKLTKAQANILSDLAHDGLAQSISPSHTMFDGDAFFTLASQKVEVDFNMLTALIPSLVARAIRSSVTSIA